MKMISFSAKHALPLLAMGALAACSTDESLVEVVTPQPSSKHEVYATAVRSSNVNTRTAYADFFDNKEGMGITWSAGDAFAAMQSGEATKVYTFSILPPEDDNAYTEKGLFKLDGEETIVNDFLDLAEGTDLNAIYPATALKAGTNQKRVVLDMAVQHQEGNTPALLANYDVMVGHAKCQPKKDYLEFDFQDHASANAGYVNSLLRFDLTFNETAGVTTVKSLSFSLKDANGNEKANTRALLNIDKKSTFLYDMPGVIRVFVENGTVGQDGTFPIWMAIPPSDFFETLEVKVLTDKGLFTQRRDIPEAYGRVLERGNRNWTGIDLSSIAPMAVKEVAYTAYPTDCQNLTSVADIEKALAAGVYYDDGAAGENQQTYYADGVETHAGFWLRKAGNYRAGGQGVSSVSSSEPLLWNTGRPNNIDNYIFLPMSAYRNSGAGYALSGSYWLRDTKDENLSYCLLFDQNSISVATAPISTVMSVCNFPTLAGSGSTEDMNVTNDEKWDNPKSNSGIKPMEDGNTNKWNDPEANSVINAIQYTNSWN